MGSAQAKMVARIEARHQIIRHDGVQEMAPHLRIGILIFLLELRVGVKCKAAKKEYNK